MSEKKLVMRFVLFPIAIALLAGFTLKTSPTLPPYHEYSVSGVLERPAGGSKSNFAVVLLGKLHSHLDTGYQMLRGVLYPKFASIPIGLTDSAGSFHIRISSQQEADSLRLAVIVPDRPMTTGVPFVVDASRRLSNWETYTVQGEPGCSGCGTESGTESKIAFYSYSFSDKSISIPF